VRDKHKDLNYTIRDRLLIALTLSHLQGKWKQTDPCKI